MPRNSEDGASYGLTLTRGLAILRSFSDTDPALSATELAKRTGIPQPTVWRLCKTLQTEGYLTPDPGGSKFRPGLALLSLGVSALSQFSLAQHARPYLVELASHFSVVAGVVMPEGLQMRVIDRHQSPSALVTYNIHVGSTLPLWASGSGWAYLAGLDPSQRAELIARIEREQHEGWAAVKDVFAKALAHFEKTGVIVGTDILGGGLTAVAIPIVAPGSSSIYCLYCSAISPLLPHELIENRLAPRMRDIAAQLRMALALER
jgi:DNA-binding IclR family transcriptional regulator